MKPTKKMNNQGSSMVTVIIAMAFVAILGSIVMTATLTNYRMKTNNLKAKDNFYTAEQALDEIRVGLQGLVSDAISEAYLEVLENYSSYDIEQKRQLMESKYFETIWGQLAENPTLNDKTYKMNLLESYLVETKWKNGTDITQGYGAILRVIDGKRNDLIAYADTGVVIKNLEVYYRNDKGEVSIIRTDIKLAIPQLQFASTTALPDVSLYGLLADEKLEFGNRGTNQLAGNVYAGEMELMGADPINKANCNVVFAKDAQVVAKNGISIQNAVFTTKENVELWTKNMVADNGKLLLEGNNNVANDLNLKGNGTELILKGNYNGYGCSLTEPDKSSAILINGNNTLLDLKDSKILTLAGHAYIGTGKKNTGETGTPGDPEKKQNILTGESIALKGNQLMYLIPGECIGVKKNIEGGVLTYGDSEFGKNPLTIRDYQKILDTTKYVELADNIVVGKLGNPLSKYLKYTGAIPKPEKIFVQTNGDTLVYYYMSFASEEKANEYFRDYYGLNQERMNEYIDFYTNGITLADPKLMVRLQLAGNATKYEEATKTSSIQNNTLTDASLNLQTNSQTSTKIFDALCTRLVTNYNEMGELKETDLSKNIVFENIVDMDPMRTFLNTYGTADTSGSLGFAVKSFQFENSGSKAVMVDNKNNLGGKTYVYGSTSDSNIHLIIATGDVDVRKDFTGLILSNGTVTLRDGVSIAADTEKVQDALRAKTEQGGTVYNLIGFLRDGKEMLNAAGSTVNGTDSSSQLSDLVVYENWSKN